MWNCIRSDRQTIRSDRQTKLIVAFGKFANTLKVHEPYLHFSNVRSFSLFCEGKILPSDRVSNCVVYVRYVGTATRRFETSADTGFWVLIPLRERLHNWFLSCYVALRRLVAVAQLPFREFLPNVPQQIWRYGNVEYSHRVGL
jgi:hypothetical protein